MVRVSGSLKFRTMIVDAEKDGTARFASAGDDRITPAGRFLRKARLDELPQFVNILKGDMNLIGPRPERQVFVDELSHTIPFFRLRNLVKPGLTGWAQVRHHYTTATEDSLVKLQYDLFYIRHRSLMLDLRIMFSTLPVIFKMKGVTLAHERIRMATTCRYLSSVHPPCLDQLPGSYAAVSSIS